MQEQPPSDPPRREPAVQPRRSRSTKPTFTPPPAPEPSRAEVAGDTPPRPRRAKVAPTVLFQPPDPGQATPPAAEGPATPRPRASAEVVATTDPGTPPVAPPPPTAAADQPVLEEAPKRTRRAPAARKAAPAKKTTPAARKGAAAAEVPVALEATAPAETEASGATPPEPGTAEPAATAAETGATTRTGRARKGTKAATAKKTAPTKRTPARRASAAPATVQSDTDEPASAQAATEPDAAKVPAEPPIPALVPPQPAAAQVPPVPAAEEVPAEPTAAQAPAEPAAAQALTEHHAAETPAEPTAPQPPAEPVDAEIPAAAPLATDRTNPAAEPDTHLAQPAVGEAAAPAQVTPKPEGRDAGQGWRAVGARVLDHPGFAPELLALAAVDALGPRAADWVERTRDAYPDADADGLARLVTRRFVRLAGTGGALAAGVGLFAPVAELTAVLWTQANLVLHLAAVYGRDPAHPDRVAELLVLTQVHPDAGTARAAVDAARTAGAPAEGPWSRAAEAAWRLATPLAAQAAGWLGLR
ncbi:hypothetical protein ABZV78_28085, partial [Micromonospora sp. NPDC004540]|uniref:hypothetical protein n=1 Tax=Micromonospora sp. NPDC004540 TaxID=3154457 RepID=UPI0033BD3893